MKKILSIVLVILVLAVCAYFFLLKKDNIYEFDFNNGAIPGATYKGKINLTTGDVDFKIAHGCSLPDKKECPDDNIYKGTINSDDLELVNKVYNKIKDNNEGNNIISNKGSFIIGISYILDGDKICDEETKETCHVVGISLLKSIIE